MTERQRLALLRKAERHLKRTTKGWKEKPVGGGSEWMAAMEALEKLEADLARSIALAGWQKIGPIQPGGISLLDMSLTHKTSGIPLFPAIDTAWGGNGGVTIIAPEPCVVDTKDTSSSPGEAIYLTGDSKLRYWVGHLNRDWPLGKKFRKGEVIGKTLPIPGSSDHAHWGVNAEALLGQGKQLKYGRDGNGPDYTLGAPTIRAQLRKVA